MKKIMTVLLLSIITQVSAAQGGCKLFRIYVKNDTPNSCYLIKRSVSSGLIYKHQSYKIKPGTTVAQFEINEDRHLPIRVELTYECGSQQSITLLSSKERCSYQNSGKIEGKIVKVNNMTGVFSSKEGSYFGTQSGSILWTLS